MKKNCLNQKMARKGNKMKKTLLVLGLLSLFITSSHAGMGTWKWNHTGNSSTLQWCSYCWNGKFGN